MTAHSKDLISMFGISPSMHRAFGSEPSLSLQACLDKQSLINIYRSALPAWRGLLKNISDKHAELRLPLCSPPSYSCLALAGQSNANY